MQYDPRIFGYYSIKRLLAGVPMDKPAGASCNEARAEPKGNYIQNTIENELRTCIVTLKVDCNNAGSSWATQAGWWHVQCPDLEFPFWEVQLSPHKVS